ncbi:prophage regulatory protein [Pseudomonas extremaustralis]|nr:prophage regulatory protein [Pseudomonas extremaustralis]
MKLIERDLMAVSMSRSARRIMRLAETEQMSGFRRSHIYALMKEGMFPQAKRIGRRAVGWDSLEVEQWISERLDVEMR